MIKEKIKENIGQLIGSLITLSVIVVLIVWGVNKLAPTKTRSFGTTVTIRGMEYHFVQDTTGRTYFINFTKDSLECVYYKERAFYNRNEYDMNRARFTAAYYNISLKEAWDIIKKEKD